MMVEQSNRYRYHRNHNKQPNCSTDVSRVQHMLKGGNYSNDLTECLARKGTTL